MANCNEKSGARKAPLRYILLVVCLLTLLSSSALVAKYVTNGGEKDNQFNKAQVSCQAHEVKEDNKKTSITVKNTSTVDVYIRVRLVNYWQTPSGSIAGRDSAVLNFTHDGNWIQGADNTYYYKDRVPTGRSTGNLLGSSIALITDPDGYIQVVKVLAEAIQADGVTSSGIPAVQDAWKEVTVDVNGDLTSYSPTP